MEVGSFCLILNFILDDNSGQMGVNDAFSSYCRYYTKPFAYCFDFEVVSVACGQGHTMLLTKNSLVYAMGSNKFGELGIGDRSVEESKIPTLVSGLSGSVISS